MSEDKLGTSVPTASTEATIDAQIVSETVAPKSLPAHLRPKPAPPKRGRPKKTQFQKLDSRKQKFVMEILNSRTQTEAAQLAGYSTKSEGSLRVQGANLMNNPRIQNALQEKLDALYPNLNEKVATKIAAIMEMPFREGPHSFGVSIAEFLATARFLQDVYGWRAPAKSLHVRARVDATRRLLPQD